MAGIAFNEYRGIRDLVVAELTGEGDSEAYGTPQALSGVQSVGTEAEAASEAHYYDNLAAVVVDAEGSDTLTLTVSVPDMQTRALIEGKTYDVAKHALVGTPLQKKYFALGYKAGLTNGKEEYVWFYKGKFTGGAQTHETKDSGTGATNVSYTYTAIYTDKKYTTSAGTTPVKYAAIESTHSAAGSFFTQVTTPDQITWTE